MVGLVVKTNILQNTRLYIKIFEAKVLCGQRLWPIDSRFSHRGVENWATIGPSYSGPRELSRPHQRYSSGWAWRVGPTPIARACIDNRWTCSKGEFPCRPLAHHILVKTHSKDTHLLQTPLPSYGLEILFCYYIVTTNKIEPKDVNYKHHDYSQPHLVSS